MTSDEILRLKQIFDSKQWDFEIYWEPMCQLFEILNSKQRELTYSLLEDFLVHDYESYPGLRDLALEQIPDELLRNAKRIIVMPIVKVREQEKLKSGHEVVRQIALRLQRRVHQLNIAVKVRKTFNELEASRENTLLIFADDFMGSSETFFDFYRDYERNHRVSSDVVAVVYFFALKAGLKALNDENIPVYVGGQQDKGISDSARISDRTEAKNLMTVLEKSMGIPDSLRFGYLQSEGLIKMSRTPDNTFPIFWWENHPYGFTPPFVRYDL